MNQPKLKYLRLCRILTYLVVIGAGILPIILVFQFPVPDGVKVVVLLASLCGLLVYLIRNFLVLMMLDMTLALLSCWALWKEVHHQLIGAEQKNEEAI